LQKILRRLDIRPRGAYHARMSSPACRFRLGSCLAAALLWTLGTGAETFRVATFNLENYLDTPTQTRAAKSAESKAKVRESIHALNPDVLALQEIGSLSALDELRGALRAEGLDFPHWQYVNGYDTNVHIAVLSKTPFAAWRAHTSDSFLLSGRRFRVSRGFGEADFQVNAHYAFTLIAAHLKSKLTLARADEAELRLEEAKLLRDKVDARLAANPNLNVVVLGDFNDSKESPSTKTIIGKYSHKLVDTRPAERNGDELQVPGLKPEPRNVTWTHYYGKDDSYTRIDFLLLSPGMAKEWLPSETYALTIPNWGVASDHRPIMATFDARDK
jgi:endonuclease/exonuclease/phosphatase family metal-dependent hydrolase